MNFLDEVLAIMANSELKFDKRNSIIEGCWLVYPSVHHRLWEMDISNNDVNLYMIPDPKNWDVLTSDFLKEECCQECITSIEKIKEIVETIRLLENAYNILYPNT